MTRILWLSHLLPYPPKGGALQRSFHLLKGAAQVGDVDLVSFRQAALHPDVRSVEEATDALSDHAEVRAVFDLPADESAFRKRWLLLTSSLTRSPYTVRWNTDANLWRYLEASSDEYDLVHFDTLGMFQYRELFPKARWVLNHHNIESDMMARRAGRARFLSKLYLSWEARRIRAWERLCGADADIHLVVSELDRERLLQVVPTADVAVVENPADCEYFTPSETPREEGSVLFVGRIDAYANAEAVRWLRDEIWPGIRRSTERCKLAVVGRNPPRDILQWGSRDPEVEVTGFVDDVRPWMSRAQVYVCPIRDGGGTRLKLLDAMAMQLPLVCHPMACEGIDVRDEEHVLLAHTTDEFVRACLRLLRDPELRERLGRRARELVESRYGVPTVWSHQAAAYGRALAKPGRRRGAAQSKG